jgi:hypothetical protein
VNYRGHRSGNDAVRHDGGRDPVNDDNLMRQGTGTRTETCPGYCWIYLDAGVTQESAGGPDVGTQGG